jgi:type IV pilus assembly protein PilF
MKPVLQVLALSLLLAACAHQSGSRSKDADGVETVNARARVHTELAAQYYARRQYPVALQELREAIQADASYAPVYNTLALVHASLLEDKEAEDNFRHAIDLAPQYSEAHNNYGRFLCGLKRRTEAMQHFELAWKNPLYATPEMALANAGQCALRSGDLAEAERFAQRALVRVGNQPTALSTIAEIQYRRGNMPMARASLQKVEAQGGLDASGLWLALKLERLAGNREAEANYGLQLRRYYPESQETAWLLNSQFGMPGGKP